MSGINIIFVIVALTTLIKKNPHYIALETIVCPISSNPLSKYLGEDIDDTASFTTFWYIIGSFENGILISYLIFLILFLVIEIITLLTHKVIRKKIEGILYYIILGFNLLFYVIFLIYTPLLLYLFIVLLYHQCLL